MKLMTGIIIGLVVVLGATLARAESCDSFTGVGCAVSFLEGDIVVNPPPPLWCPDENNEFQPLPKNWHCLNPVNNPNQPSWCLCEGNILIESLAHAKSLVTSLPASIPFSRWNYVVDPISSDNQVGECKRAIQDWMSCGFTVDGLNNSNEYWKALAGFWKAQYLATQ